MKVIKLKIWPKILCSFEYRCTSLFLVIDIRIKKNQVLMWNYTCKYSKIDINNQVRLTPRSRLCNRLWWLVTVVLKFINIWKQKIQRQKISFANFHKANTKTGFLSCISPLFETVYIQIHPLFLHTFLFYGIRKWTWKYHVPVFIRFKNNIAPYTIYLLNFVLGCF